MLWDTVVLVQAMTLLLSQGNSIARQRKQLDAPRQGSLHLAVLLSHQALTHIIIFQASFFLFCLFPPIPRRSVNRDTVRIGLGRGGPVLGCDGHFAQLLIISSRSVPGI